MLARARDAVAVRGMVSGQTALVPVLERRPRATRVFGVVEEARSFVYVFDHSDSMVSALSYTSEGKTVFSITALEAAKAELLRSLDDLDANQGFQIVFYNHVFNVFEDQGLSTHLIRATPENKQRASGFVASTYGAGSTNHMPGAGGGTLFEARGDLSIDRRRSERRSIAG